MLALKKPTHLAKGDKKAMNGKSHVGFGDARSALLAANAELEGFGARLLFLLEGLAKSDPDTSNKLASDELERLLEKIGKARSGLEMLKGLVSELLGREDTSSPPPEKQGAGMIGAPCLKDKTSDVGQGTGG